MPVPVIFMVGADKGGVGKTTLARALLNWLDERKVASLRVFDTEFPKGTLRKFRLGAEVVDVTQVEDQMRIFDGVEESPATVVDITAGQLSPTLDMMERAGLLKDVTTGTLRLLILHIIGPTRASLDEVGEIMGRIGGGAVRHVLVKNRYNDTKFRIADDPDYIEALRTAAANTIDVPHLSTTVMEEIERQRVGFAEFIKGVDILGQNVPKRNSRVLVGNAAYWLDAVWREFDRVGLANALM